MKKIIIGVLLLSNFSVFAQTSSVDMDKEINALKQQLNILKLENGKLHVKVKALSDSTLATSKALNDLKTEVKANSNAITQTNDELGIKIQETGKTSEAKITAVDQSLSKNSLYGIIGVLAAALLSGLLYWLLSKRQKSDKSDFIEQLSKTKSSIEESIVKEFGKQTELMETQLKTIEQQKNTIPTNSNTELDHSLALKVADEITLIERNVNLMDAKTKGLKQLVASVGKLKDNLAANGYEMPELLSKQFHQGMKVIVTTSIPDENLEKGSEVITKVIKPQVNFNDKMIQTAQIEVSVGY